jgi:ferric-dicitrate binding protein FerR (iron transport regulator)
MATEPSHIANLLLRLHRETLSETDRQELDAWIAASEENAFLYRELTEENLVQAGLRQIEGYDERRVRQRILAHMPGVFSASSATEIPLEVRMSALRRIMIRWSAAAAVIALLGIGAWWLTLSRRTATPIAQTIKPADIAAPATNRAMITLGNGQQVYLDSAASGALAQQGNAQVVKEANGQVAYKVENITNKELLFNTLTNPRGSQVVTLTLSDGTKVWLNAESSIRYPAVFVGSDRTVEMTGEAYFEVAKNASQPFKVMIKDREEIDVLGTSFNINAYGDEPALKTTLLEGSVRVEPLVGVNNNKEKPSVVLNPGQQANLIVGENRNDSNLTVDRAADVEQAVAWKEGRFAFNRADLPTVMRQLARWYNVDVSYEGKIPERHFSGRIGKSLTLDQVLKGLTQARVHYTIETGNKLIIRP